MADDDNGSVRFTVKELLLGIRGDVAAIDAKLDMKADRERVQDLANMIATIQLERAAELATREAVVREFRDAQEEQRAHRTWLWRLTIGLGSVCLAVGTNLSRLYLGL